MAEAGPAGAGATDLDEDIMVDRLTIGDIMEMESGSHEVDVLCDEMESGTLQNVTCKKYPGHKGFIPVGDFKASHLPECYRDDIELVELIKVIADLTVKLKMSIISQGRPELYPGKKSNYPFHDKRGKKITSFATGRVFEVLRYRYETDGKKCPCQGCKKGTTPSTAWGEVNIVTATHAVFDDVEAKRTLCTLNYDDINSEVITIEGVGVHKDDSRQDSDASSDRCWLICVTCNQDLLDRLEKIVARYEDLTESVADRYLKGNVSHKLTVVVSHPHGQSKQVSVGKWINRWRTEDNNTAYAYTARTCPASSGAPVVNIGTGTSFFNHIHAGTGKTGMNFSGDANEDRIEKLIKDNTDVIESLMTEYLGGGAHGFSSETGEDTDEMLAWIMSQLNKQ